MRWWALPFQIAMLLISDFLRRSLHLVFLQVGQGLTLRYSDHEVLRMSALNVAR